MFHHNVVMEVEYEDFGYIQYAESNVNRLVQFHFGTNPIDYYHVFVKYQELFQLGLSQ
jgi:hypothetical protein